MTVGLPGAGIGGIFYLLSALAMPFHAAAGCALDSFGIRRRDQRRAPSWNLIWRQFATAVAIIAGLWLTGLILAQILIAHPTALGHVQTTSIGKRLPNVLRVAAVMVSMGTLAAVLLTVQIARLVVASHPKRTAEEKSPVVKIAATVLFLILTPAASAQNPPRSEAAPHVAIADRAFADGDTALARREYEAALSADLHASRALYRLGELSKSDPRRAESYFRRYVAIEQGDAWGWIALGNTLAARRNYSAALGAYERAAGIAPSERDVIVGRARVLAAAGRTDASIVQYERWLSSHPSDAEAQLELAIQQRRAGRYREAERSFASANRNAPSSRAVRGAAYSGAFGAPAIEVTTGGGRDSEANQSIRASAIVSAQVGDRVRGQVGGGRRWLSGFSDVTIDEGFVGFLSRPLASFRFEAAGGVARPRSTITVTDTIPASSSGSGSGSGPGRGSGRGRNGGTPPPGTIIQTSSESSANIFIGAVRGVLRQPGGRSSLDLRATRSLLDATPVLAINQVVRTEGAARADVGVLPRVKLRGGARAASYNAIGDDNSRVSLLGGIAVAATNAIEVSGVFQRVAFSHPTTSGYFAPKLAQLAEAGTYAELESESGIVLAIDGGAGMQRLQEFGGAAMGGWEPSYRLFASLDVPMRPGSAFHLELDSYDSRLGSDAPSSTSSWRFISLSGSIRLALR